MEKVIALDSDMDREEGNEEANSRGKDGAVLGGRSRAGWVITADLSGGGDPELRGTGEADVMREKRGGKDGRAGTTRETQRQGRGWMNGWF